MDDTTPVEDWTTDWDHADDAWSKDPFPIWDELRSGCPVARTERYGGGWLPTTHDGISAIAYDTDTFTSRFVLINGSRPPDHLAPAGPVPPISSDPPYHQSARRKLLPMFSPKAVAALEPGTRAFCEQLLDDLADRDVVDAAAEYAQHIPIHVISQMLGFPESDSEIFVGFVHRFLEGIAVPLEERLDEVMELFGYLQAQIDDHMEHPRDDLTSYLIEIDQDPDALRGALQRIGMDFDGEEVTEDSDPDEVAETLLPPVLGTMALLLLAGIDTTWSAIGASIWHLAGHPDDRERLVAEPELMPLAIEEFLRAYAPVTMARLVRDDVEWNGCPMKKDDWVLLPFPAANRDPEAFERADEVIIDRAVNRHAAFGLGIHRCVGSNLARMEMRVALEVWLDRFPDFDLADPSAVTWSHGQVRGPRHLPVTIH